MKYRMLLIEGRICGQTEISYSRQLTLTNTKKKHFMALDLI